MVCIAHKSAEGIGYQQFYGASLSYGVNQTDDPNLHEVNMLLISGWVLGKGPCGQSCSEMDVGRETFHTRQAMTTNYGEAYFGQWFEEYRKLLSRKTRNITTEIVSNMAEKVFGVNLQTEWEQEIMTTNFLLNSSSISKQHIDIKYEGNSWRNRTNQGNKTSDTGEKWHLKFNVHLGVRSDTGKPNRSPVVLTKPYYRLKLDDINEIHIAAFDPDGDFVKCKQSTHGVALTLSANPLKGLTVKDNCTIRLNTSAALGYTDDYWGGIAVAVRDYNKKKIYIGGDKYTPVAYSIGESPVQFLVQVLKNPTFPKFVNPTLESNHEFTIYIGATWTVNIYAEAIGNAVIQQFYSYGTQNESIILTNISKDDSNRNHVRKVQVSWTPEAGGVGGHIICTRAIDNMGVDSSTDKCFIVQVKDRTFNASLTHLNQSLPYFINLPTDSLALVCGEEKTCALPIYVNSSNKIIEVRITTSGLDMSEIGKEITRMDGRYKTDLFLRHSASGRQSVCLVATDLLGFSSEETCIFVEIEAHHPCYSSPCVNSGECRRHVNDTSDYQCVNCPSGYYGRNCEIKEIGFCDSDPCNGQLCLSRTNACHCRKSSGLTGSTCSINIDDCHGVDCSNHGICKDGINNHTCKCFIRYNGSNCEIDRCPLGPAHAVSCPGDFQACAPNQCYHGICNGNGTCLCKLGYSEDANCRQALGNLGTIYGNVTILPPSLHDRSTVTCYTMQSCVIKLYFSVSSKLNVQISVIKVTEKLKFNTSASSALEWNEIDGVDGMMAGDVSVISNEEMQGYICALVNDGMFQDSRCFALNFISNPINVNSSAEFIQRDRSIKFISPTPNGESIIVCRKSEVCYIMLYTSLNTTGHCDMPISTDEGVAVLDVTFVTYGCQSQVAIQLQTEGNHHICFQSTIISAEAQTRCFRIQVYGTDPCSSDTCQNNGICLYNDDASDNTTCACQIGYRGEHCERGPCQPADNNCLQGYCDVTDHNITCICPIGLKGDRCQTSILSGIADFSYNGAQFTDIALPSVISCVRNRPCSIALIASGTETPNLQPGYTSLYIEITDIATQRIENGSYLISVNLTGRSVGLWDTCVLSMNNFRENKDELCFKVNVDKGTSMLYRDQDKPHFIDPSVPPNSELECKVNESCHLFMSAKTGGQYLSTECVDLFVTVSLPDVTKYHIFSSCEACMNSSSSIQNCQFDMALYLTVDVDLCLQARNTLSKIVGEKRCFHLLATSDTARKGCQILQCKNGGFCDGHKEPAKCHCPAMFTGTMCESDLSLNRSSLTNQALIGGGGFPNEVLCEVGKPCEIPHHILDSRLTLTTGYMTPGLKINQSTITSGQSTGILTVESSSAGKKVLCIQALQGSLVKDEVCMTVNFVANGRPPVDKDKPYFIAPTPPRESVILCNTNSSCHLDIHFPKGNIFQSALTCPSLSETSTPPVDGVYIFPGTENPTDCSCDVSYITPNVNIDTEEKLCFQVSLPGKRGEERCFVILIVSNVTNTVIRPCSGMICNNNAACVADLSDQPPTGKCICQSGYDGADCSQEIQSLAKLPGYLDTNSTKNSTQLDGTPHFDQTSGIPSNIVCIENSPCTVQITYSGDPSKPPLPAYISSPLNVSSITVTPTPAKGTNIALYTVTNIRAGVHKLCLQTTINGSRDGVNLDEICFNITVPAGSSRTPSSSTASYFENSAYSNGSTLSCQTNSVCHLSFIMKANPNCSELHECGVGLPGLHVFDIQHGSDCLADVAIRTGQINTLLDICLSSGGQERHIQVDVTNTTEYGPCQRLHCVNGGFCNAREVTPVCKCTSRFSGPECETAVVLAPSATIDITSTSAVSLTSSLTDGITSTSAVALAPSATIDKTSTSLILLTSSVTDGITSTSAIALPPSATIDITSTSAVSLTSSVTDGITNTSAIALVPSATIDITSTPGAVTSTPTSTYDILTTSGAVILTPTSTHDTTSTSVIASTPTSTYDITSTSAVELTPSATEDISRTSASSVTPFVTYNITSTSDVCTGEPASAAAQRAKQVVKSGKVSCFCIVRGPDNVDRRVQIIKRRPKMTIAQILQHAGYGAGGMTGGLLICLVLYHVVRRLKKPKGQDRVQRIHKTPQWYME